MTTKLTVVVRKGFGAGYYAASCGKPYCRNEEWLGFFGAMLISVGNIIRHPRRFRWNAVVTGFEAVGVQALFIIGLMSFLIGVVVGQQGAVQLEQFGADHQFSTDVLRDGTLGADGAHPAAGRSP